MRYRFEPQIRGWRDERGRFVPARRGRRRSDRLGRAVELAALGNVIETGDGWTVVSADGAHCYRTSLDGCDCPDSLYRRTRCKHRLALGIATRRPPGSKVDTLRGCVVYV